MKLQRDVTFKQSVATGRSGELIKFAQDEILLNGRRVGYVGHGHGENANLIAPVDEETKRIIAEAVEIKRGSAPKRVNIAPQISDSDDGLGVCDDE